VLAEDLRPKVRNAAVRAQVERELGGLLERINASVSEYEQLKMIVVTPEPWSVEAGTLTPTLKIRRARIETAVAPQVQGWYATPSPVVWA